MKVITYVTKKDQYYNSLEDSCKKFNYTLITLGLNTKWNGMSDKIKGVRNYLAELKNKDEFVIVVDGYDVIACRDSKDLLATFNSTFDDNHIIFNAERLTNSYLISMLWETSYSSKKCGNTKYNKLNAGALMAKTSVLLEFYDYMIAEFNLNEQHAKSDQKLIYNIMDKDERNIRVDSHCNIFTTFGLQNDLVIKSDKKLYNSYSKTYPFFIHGPGKNTKMDKYINAVDVKLDYTKENELSLAKIHNEHIHFDLLVFIVLLVLFTVIFFAYRFKRSA